MKRNEILNHVVPPNHGLNYNEMTQTNNFKPVMRGWKRIPAKSLKNWEASTFVTKLMKLDFLVTYGYTNKRSSILENASNIYNNSKLFVVTSCCTWWVATWKFAKYDHFICVLPQFYTEGFEYTAWHLLHISSSYQTNTKKFSFLILTTVFGWRLFAIEFVEWFKYY